MFRFDGSSKRFGLCLISATVWLATIINLAAPACAQSTDTSERVVLLRNGNLIRGVLVPSGMHLSIRQPSGTELIVLKDSIDAHFETAEGAFQHLLTRQTTDNVPGLVDLFHWCMRYQLWPQAQATLDQLQFAPLSANQLLALHQQLQLASRPRLPKVAPNPSASSIQFSDLPPAVGNREFAKSENPDAQLLGAEINDSQVTPVEFLSPAVLDRHHLLPQPDLDQLVATIPTEAWQEFLVKIEPCLIRSCNNAGCHDSNQRHLTLIDLGLDRANPIQITQQNLYRVLQFLDPLASSDQSLVVKAQSAHGSLSRAVWNPDSKELVELQAWVASLGEQQTMLMQEILDRAPRLNPPTLDGAVPKSDTVTAQPKLENHSNAKNNSPQGSFSLAPLNPSQSKSIDPGHPAIPSLTADPRTFVPRDPFDPEIFNRFFLKKDR